MSEHYLTHACPHGVGRDLCMYCLEIDVIIKQLVEWTVDHIMPEFYEDFLTIADYYRDDNPAGKKSPVAIDRIIADGDLDEIEEMVELVTNGDVKSRRKK